ILLEIRLDRDEEQHREIAHTFLNGFIPSISGLVDHAYAVGNSDVGFRNNFIGSPKSQFAIDIDEWVDIMLVHEKIDDLLCLVHVGLHRSKRVEPTGIVQKIEYNLLFFMEIVLDMPGVEAQDFLLVECKVDGDGGAYKA